MRLINSLLKIGTKVSLALALLIGAQRLEASSASITVLPNTFTNLLANVTFNSGSVFVTGLTITAPTNISTLFVYDTPTNSLTFTNAAYTNIQIVASNYVFATWTNYYGVVNSETNIALVHITNNIAASTNNWPLRLIVSANAAIAPTVVYNPNVFFLDGLWATNTTTNTATVVVTYRQ